MKIGQLRLIVGDLSAHPLRFGFALTVISVGVAMGYAVHLINHSALAEFTHALQTLQGRADVTIRGPRAGFDEVLYGELARLPEVGAASPSVEILARLPDRDAALRLLGIDVFRAAAVQPDLVGLPVETAARRGERPPAVLDPNMIFLSPAALAWLGVEAGDELDFQVGLSVARFIVAGSLPSAGAGVRLGVIDIAAAQWRFDRLGRLSAVDLKLRPGVGAAEFAARLAKRLPAGIVVESPEDRRLRISNISRAYRVNLNVLALVALFTGGFLVLSTQVLSVVRRRSQLALLRVLGLTRRSLALLVLSEAGLTGMLGAALGLAVGYAVAAFALTRFGADLGGGYFAGVTPSVRTDAPAAALFWLLGVAAALAGAVLPALEVARAQPAQALKSGDEQRAFAAARSPLAGLALLFAGGLLTKLPPIDGLPLAGYMAIALILIGGIGCVPFVARTVFTRLPAGRRPVVQLAASQLAGVPGRASLAVAGIVASFSLMAAMAIMVASFRHSLELWLSHVLPAELYVRAAAGSDSAFLSHADATIIATLPGVARAEFQRTTQLTLDPRRPPVTLIARPIDPNEPWARLPLTGSSIRTSARDPPPVWVSEAVVDLYGLSSGKSVALPLGGKPVDVLVAGVWRDYARQHGSIVIGSADYRRITGDDRVNDAALWLKPGEAAVRVADRIRDALPGGDRLEFAEPGEIRAASLRIFDRSFMVTYLLEGVAIAIGLTGIAAHFGAEAIARRREFGMLRHIGLTSRDIALMLALEGLLAAALGVAVGLALGWLVSLILIDVINPQSFHWTMDVYAPWALLSTVALLLMLAAVGTAVLAGRQAMHRSAIAAVREDW